MVSALPLDAIDRPLWIRRPAVSTASLGRYYENTEDEPDVLVRRRPEAITEGRDEQLEAAVQTLLKQLDQK